MKLTKISAGIYHCDDWRVMRLLCGSWIVWNVKTQTRTARQCSNTKWYSTLTEARFALMGLMA